MPVLTGTIILMAGMADTCTAIGAAAAVVMCTMSAGHGSMGGGYGFATETQSTESIDRRA
jgi:hypothetical protein